jgi:hypothetical protein
LVIVDADGAEFVPRRTWICPPPPPILGGQVKPLTESLPTTSCQQPDE